jgi:hypothetical protein
MMPFPRREQALPLRAGWIPLALACLFLGAAIPPAPAEPLALPSFASVAPQAELPELLAKGKIVRIAASGAGPSLLPRYSAASEISGLIAAEKPNLVVESLYRYPRPMPADPSAELHDLYNTVLAISSLEGIQYYSASRGRYRTFYSESYRIDGPDTKRRLPDAQAPAGMLPSTESYYAFQRDTTFGPNVYRCAYRSFPEAVSLESINLTSLSLLALPVMSPNKLHIRLLVIQTEEAILFYVVNTAEMPSIPLVRDQVQESIANRTEALFKWFASRQERQAAK